MARAGIKRNLKQKWRFSYFIIMAIPIVLFVVYAMASLYTLRNSVDKANRATLGAISNELNSAFMEVDALCEELIVSDSFIAFSTRSLREFDPYSLYLRTLDLRHMVNSRSNLSECVLYSMSGNFYITGQYYGELLSINRNDVLDISESGYLGEILSRNNGNRTYVLDVSGNGGDHKLLVIRPLSFVRSSLVGDLAVAVLVDISDIFSEQISQAYDIVMFDLENREEEFHFGSNVDARFVSEAIGKLDDIGGRVGRNRILTSDSSIRGSRYFMIVDEAEYFQDLYTVLWLVGVALILDVVISLMVIRRLVAGHWGRFSDAIQASGTDIGNLESVSNPYEPFVFSVTKLKEENRTHIILRMVMSEDYVLSREEAAELGIISGDGAFCIVLAMLDGESSDILSTLEEKKTGCIPFESDFDVSFIAEAKEEVLMRIHGELDSVEGISYFAVSKIVNDIGDLHKAFMQACNIMEYRKTMFMSDSGSEGYAVYLAAMSEIENNYSDVQLNVSQIADRLGVSIVYLSKCFKKHKETNISDYLTAFRIAKAKEMLSDRKTWNLPMKEVASQCGFGSVRTFMRVFSKSEGVSPGQFRTSSLGSEKEENDA